MWWKRKFAVDGRNGVKNGRELSNEIIIDILNLPKETAKRILELTSRPIESPYYGKIEIDLPLRDAMNVLLELSTITEVEVENRRFVVDARKDVIDFLEKRNIKYRRIR